MPILMYIQRIEVRLEQKLKNQLYSFPHSLCSRPRYALRVMTSTQFNNMAFGNDTSVYIVEPKLISVFIQNLGYFLHFQLQDSLQKISSNSRSINTPVLLYEGCGHIVQLNIFGSLFLKSDHQNLVVFQYHSNDLAKSCTNTQHEETYYFAHHDREQTC